MPTPGWVNSDRWPTLPPDWRPRVAAVKARDAGRCQAPGCTSPGTECDHIGDRLNHELWNLQLLCAVHHTQKTIHDRGTRPRSDRRPPERHPGLRGN